MTQTQMNFIVRKLTDRYLELSRYSFFNSKEWQKFIKKEIASGKHTPNMIAFTQDRLPSLNALFPTLMRKCAAAEKRYRHIHDLRQLKLKAKLDELMAQVILGPINTQDLSAMLKELNRVVE